MYMHILDVNLFQVCNNSLFKVCDMLMDCLTEKRKTVIKYVGISPDGKNMLEPLILSQNAEKEKAFFYRILCNQICYVISLDIFG